MTVYPTLGFDPVGAETGANVDIAHELRRAVRRLGEVCDVLDGTGSQHWEGRAAEAFRGSIDVELRPRVAQAHESFASASRAVDAWVDALPAFRSRAQQLEDRARAATLAAEQAAVQLQGLVAPAADADPRLQQSYLTSRTTALTVLTTAQGELGAILAEARALQEEVDGSAHATAGALSTAMDRAPDKPGVWGEVKDVVDSALHWATEAFDWVMDNLAPVLQQLARVIGAVCTVLAIVAFVVGFVFPPAFAVAGTLGTVAKVASFVDLAVQGLRVVHGEEGAAQGFVLAGAGMVAGIGLARAIGPIALSCEQNLQTGLFVPAIAGVGREGGSSVATAAYTINPNYFHSLTYWGITRYRDLTSGLTTIQNQGRDD